MMSRGFWQPRDAMGDSASQSYAGRGMDHFLSGLDHGSNPWYGSRPTVASHEFAIGNSSFQLIPIPGNASSHSVYQSVANQVNSQSAFRAPTESPKVKSEKDDEDRSGTPSPSVALTPLSTNMAQNSNKTKSCGTGRWDTKKVCNICGKVLSRGDKLKNHIRTHTNNFPFHCGTCGQGFLRSEGLRVHTRIHTGERPYVCIVCSKGYTRKDKLTRHAVVHTGERPFVCQHCGKSFTRKDKLQRHEMIHKVDKPFTCVPCNLEFVRQETFNTHMEKKHPERLPYTVVQQPRSVSPSYQPQGVNLSNLSESKNSSSSTNTKVSASSHKLVSTLPTTSSAPTLLSAASQSGSGSSSPAGHSLLSGTSLLSGSSIFSGTVLSSGVQNAGIGGAHV